MIRFQRCVTGALLLSASLTGASLIGASLTGCTSVWQQVSARPDDFAEYRQFRVALDLPQRFRAAGSYLQDMPHGRWHGEVRQWVEQAGGEYLRRFWNDETRLLDYLNWAPNGPHAALLNRRLQVLASQGVAQRKNERKLLAEAHGRESQFERATTLRKELIAGYKGWLSHIASLRSFGQQTSALPDQFLHDFREVEPKAICDSARCSKAVLLPYAGAAERKQSWRELLFEVDLKLDQGALQQASIEGVGLFASVAEALQKHAVAADDVQGKAEALGATVALTAISLEAILPQARCEQPAISPVVLARECDGVRMEMRVAEQADGPDRIVIRPSFSAPGRAVAP
ncbi:MAG TPA: hypothetical protein VL137_17285 [Polyangiaceae bacterium]|nr:hypothetical protein [Polyangiaceae bacterium]